MSSKIELAVIPQARRGLPEIGLEEGLLVAKDSSVEGAGLSCSLLMRRLLSFQLSLCCSCLFLVMMILMDTY